MESVLIHVYLFPFEMFKSQLTNLYVRLNKECKSIATAINKSMKKDLFCALNIHKRRSSCWIINNCFYKTKNILQKYENLYVKKYLHLNGKVKMTTTKRSPSIN